MEQADYLVKMEALLQEPSQQITVVVHAQQIIQVVIVRLLTPVQMEQILHLARMEEQYQELSRITIVDVLV